MRNTHDGRPLISPTAELIIKIHINEGRCVRYIYLLVEVPLTISTKK